MATRLQFSVDEKFDYNPDNMMYFLRELNTGQNEYRRDNESCNILRVNMINNSRDGGSIKEYHMKFGYPMWNLMIL